MPKPEWFDPERMFQRIRAESARRRSNPLDCFQEFLNEVWRGYTPEEAEQRWKTLVEQSPWFADDALHCLDAILSAPPDNLISIMREYGWISLEHDLDESGMEQPFSFEEYVAWLRDMRDRFRTIYQEYPATEEELKGEEE